MSLRSAEPNARGKRDDRETCKTRPQSGGQASRLSRNGGQDARLTKASHLIGHLFSNAIRDFFLRRAHNPCPTQEDYNSHLSPSTRHVAGFADDCHNAKEHLPLGRQIIGPSATSDGGFRKLWLCAQKSLKPCEPCRRVRKTFLDVQAGYCTVQSIADKAAAEYREALKHKRGMFSAYFGTWGNVSREWAYTTSPKGL